MKKSYFIVYPTDKLLKGFPTLWEPHKETLEQLFKRRGHEYSNNRPVSVKKITQEEAEKYAQLTRT